jgi:uncharacterized membrane protein
VTDRSGGPGPRRPGSIERTLAGDVDLGVEAVLREAWQWVDGVKAVVAAGALLVYLAVVVVISILAGVTGLTPEELTQQLSLELVVTLLLVPFQAGMFLFGLRRSLGQTAGLSDLFSAYGRALPILAVGVLQMTAVMLGMMLLVLPGIYASIALFLAVPLKAERDLPVLACLETSVRLVHRAFWQVFALQLISVGLIVIGVLSVIGWIWTIPWAVMIYGIIYRQLAGTASGVPPSGPQGPRGRATADF